MEFLNQVLRVPADLERHVRSLLTVGSGAERARTTLFEELGEHVDAARPPRWLLIGNGREMELLVHLATPFFVAQGYDADEYMDGRDDEFVYVDSAGDASLRSDGKEYDVDRPDFDEVEAYLCSSQDLLADFEWFDDTPESSVFLLIMEDADTAYRGALQPYEP